VYFSSSKNRGHDALSFLALNKCAFRYCLNYLSLVVCCRLAGRLFLSHGTQSPTVFFTVYFKNPQSPAATFRGYIFFKTLYSVWLTAAAVVQWWLREYISCHFWATKYFHLDRACAACWTKYWWPAVVDRVISALSDFHYLDFWWMIGHWFRIRISLAAYCSVVVNCRNHL